MRLTKRQGQSKEGHDRYNNAGISRRCWGVTARVQFRLAAWLLSLAAIPATCLPWKRAMFSSFTDG